MRLKTKSRSYRYDINRPRPTVFSPNAGKYGPEITPYLDTFHAVKYTNYIICLGIVMAICIKQHLSNI